MKVLQRYFAAEILRSVAFVLLAFLALFAFFDLMNELKSVGKNGYQLGHAALRVLLGLPGYAYDLIPIAALIGTIYVLAQFAARSEFTIMRVSGMSRPKVAVILAKIGVLFAVLTFVFGEFIAPRASSLAEKVKLNAQGRAISQEFRSGMWAKDTIRENGVTGPVLGTRFLNVRQIQPDGLLRNVTVYEFDGDFRMTSLITAESGKYLGSHAWLLQGVAETRFLAPGDGVADRAEAVDGIDIHRMPERRLVSEITPELLAVLFSDPDRMSAYDLSAYSRHLAENRQRSERYEIAFWKKVTYPFAVFVMMALALPFAYLHARAGGVSLKIFTGIMIGVSFHLINNLFSHIGLLHTWPPFITAILPSALFLLLAMFSLYWVERR